jgi:hypothetical protein
VLLVGCGSEPNYSGNYSLNLEYMKLDLELKRDSSFIAGSSIDRDSSLVGNWKVEGDLLICEGTSKIKLNVAANKKTIIKFHKNTLEVISLIDGGKEEPLAKMIPEGEDGLYFKKHGAESVLTKCTTCKGKVSREAKTCPHCGQPNPVN